jgi:glycosyltransferase involved in cell wall biosynthesis
VDFFTPGTEPPTNEAFVFTLIANLNPNKGIDVLLKAFRQAFTTEATRLNIVGEGKQRAALENLTRQLGLTERVQFLGFQPREQVRDIIRASQVVVSSSYHETFGITLVEALACGKPIVATRSGGPDRIVNERNGLLVPTGDPAALAAALRQIYETYGQYDPVQIRAECLATFSDEAMVRRLEEVYTGLVV